MEDYTTETLLAKVKEQTMFLQNVENVSARLEISTWQNGHTYYTVALGVSIRNGETVHVYKPACETKDEAVHSAFEEFDYKVAQVQYKQLKPAPQSQTASLSQVA